MKMHPAARLTLLALLASGVLVLAGCGGGGGDSTGAATTIAANVPRWQAWLCRPDDALSACNSDLSTTAVAAAGSPEVQPNRVPKQRPIDCFYVYPSVTSSRTG